MQLESIKPDALIDIQIGAAFYKDLQDAMFYLISFHSDEELQQMADKINAGQDDQFEDWEKAIQSIMLLCTEIEERAREQGKTQMVDNPDQKA